MATTNDTYPTPATQAAAPKSAIPVHRHFPEIEAAMARLTAENAIKYGRTQPGASNVPASTLTRTAPRPTVAAFDTLSLCRNCGDEYYPEDIPAALADVGQYGTCADCREQAATEMAAWAVGVWS